MTEPTSAEPSAVKAMRALSSIRDNPDAQETLYPFSAAIIIAHIDALTTRIAELEDFSPNPLAQPLKDAVAQISTLTARLEWADRIILDALTDGRAGREARAYFAAAQGITNTEDEPPPQEDGIGCCPQCGSGDVHFCNISVRPYCNECKYWGRVNFGTKADAIKEWNRERAEDEI